jgi:cell division protein FtsI/penicillin-binding protein 2
LDPSRIRVVGKTGTASHRTTSGQDKENISVLMAANAASEKLPPLIVFKGKNV